MYRVVLGSYKVYLVEKSLYISRMYGTEITIWVGFGPVGNTEKKIWANYEQLLRVFSYFRGHFLKIL